MDVTMSSFMDSPKFTGIHRDQNTFAILLIIISLCISPLKTSQAVTLLDLATAHLNQENPLFNTFEYQYRTFENLPSWSSALKRSQSEFSTFRACVHNETKCKTTEQRAWREFIISHKNKSRPKIIKSVNRYFNKWPYKSDRIIYGKDEYWATLGQFMKNSGDCEDYAIAKYYTLKALGFKEDEIRIVVLTHPLRKKGHVVLAIYDQRDILILDSLTDTPKSHRAFLKYTPVYSVNQTTQWVHSPKPTKNSSSYQNLNRQRVKSRFEG